MADRIGVTQHPVSVTPVDGVQLMQLKHRIEVMERELNHLRTAIADIKNGINSNNSRTLTSGVMNSRNWTLSIAMSHSYIQHVLGAKAPDKSGFAGQDTPDPSRQLETLFMNAVRAGGVDGIRDRIVAPAAVKLVHKNPLLGP